jgi:hypothetical protein
MEKLYFSGLIFCSLLLLTAAQTNGQSFGQDENAPVHQNSINHSSLYAYRENDNVIVLRWSTGNESAVDRYVVEKSTDSVHFNELHEVVARGVIDAAGDSAYQDEDPYPGSSINYYRLATIFKDGNALYSSVVRADVNSARTPILTPTVLTVGGSLRMNNFHEQPMIVDFYSVSGVRVGSYMVNGTSFNINTYGMTRGLLIYRICDENHALINAGKILLQ